MEQEDYDCAISFLQNGTKGTLTGGVQEFVLKRVTAKRKIAFIHGDYGRSGAHYLQNDRLLGEFDRVAACSDGCGAALKAVLPELSDRVVTVRNCSNIPQIRALAQMEPVVYPNPLILTISKSSISFNFFLNLFT